MRSLRSTRLLLTVATLGGIAERSVMTVVKYDRTAAKCIMTSAALTDCMLGDTMLPRGEHGERRIGTNGSCIATGVTGHMIGGISSMTGGIVGMITGIGRRISM